MSTASTNLFEQAGNLLLQRLSPVVSNRGLNLTFGFGFIGFIAMLFALAVFQPGYSFDLVAYLGAALQQFDPGASPMQAWELTRQAVPEDVYRDLTNAYEYRVVQSSDEAAFVSNLPLYSAKMGYIYLLGWTAGLLGWIAAANWISLAAGLLLGLVCLVWMARENCLQAAPVVAVALLALNYFDALRYPSPDVVATALAMAAAYLWIRAREDWAMALFFVAFLFRPDTMLFVFALLLASLAFSLPKLRTLLVFAAMLVCSALIKGQIDHPGWWVHYYFSNVQIQNTLVGFEPAFSLFAFAKGQARGVWMSLTQFNWPILLTFALAALIAMQRAGMAFPTRHAAVLLACVLAIGGKFLVFPLPDDRLYMALIMTIILVLAEILRPQLAAR